MAAAAALRVNYGAIDRGAFLTVPSRAAQRF